MITVIVHIDIKPEYIYECIVATKIAQEKTLQETGCHLYTINKDKNTFSSIFLVEVYENNDAIEIHKNTQHFIEWRDTVEPYMNKPRSITKYESF